MTSYFEPRCKVCKSKNRPLYEKKRFEEGYSYDKLEELARTLNEDISYWSFQSHFSKHCRAYYDQLVEAQTRRRVEKESEEIEAILREIKKNLEIIRSMTKKIIETKPLDVRTANAIRGLLSEARLTLEAQERLYSKIPTRPKSTFRDMVKTLMDLIKELDLSPDQMEKLLTHLERRMIIGT